MLPDDKDLKFRIISVVTSLLQKQSNVRQLPDDEQTFKISNHVNISKCHIEFKPTDYVKTNSCS